MKLEDIRRDYLKGGLNREDLHPDPHRQFEYWLQQAVDAELSADPTAMTLATVDSHGRPSQRVVLLKSLDQRGFVFYTNYESHKGRDIAVNPNVSLHFAWLPLERQVIIGGEAEKLTEAESEAYFRTRPRSSQIGAWTSRQSAPIDSREALDEKFRAIDETFADEAVPLPSFWGGYRVRADLIEFWQGRGQRLHDRFLYRKVAKGWNIERLQP